MQGKTVKESTVVMSHIMLPQDANPFGNVHGGVIMKYVDDAAGVVATRHVRGSAVTVSVDRLNFFHPVYIGNLLVVRASLNMVGKSSMEIGVRVEAENLVTGQVNHVVTAYLTFVALDKNQRPCPVPPLILESAEEKRRNSLAISRRQERLAQIKK